MYTSDGTRLASGDARLLAAHAPLVPFPPALLSPSSPFDRSSLGPLPAPR